ncbi:unnamed protein product, partial [Linum tenue]
PNLVAHHKTKLKSVAFIPPHVSTGKRERVCSCISKPELWRRRRYNTARETMERWQAGDEVLARRRRGR